ncbi:hypothetical protein SEA_PASCALRANGO_83 [Mycobacterium phage PascalRango]|nr:hypothetical protein SEA_PASCALRANGO_83 [Mycobacterium phage PascalRango]
MMDAPAPAAGFFVGLGSIYCPGWHVWERVRSDYHVSRARFDDRADAEEFLAALIDAENFDRNSFGYPLDS